MGYPASTIENLGMRALMASRSLESDLDFARSEMEIDPQFVGAPEFIEFGKTTGEIIETVVYVPASTQTGAWATVHQHMPVVLAEVYSSQSDRAMLAGSHVYASRIATFSNLAVSGRFATASQILRNLGRLTDGWAGDDTVAPSHGVIKDFQAASIAFPPLVSLPEIEVDPDDGSVVLRWITAEGKETFSLTFVGNGSVTGYFSSDTSAEPAWSAMVTEARKLATKFTEENVLKLLTD